MILSVQLGESSYDIVLEEGCLGRAGEYLDLARKVLVVSDQGVPEEYARTVAYSCKQPTLCRVEQGEGSKSIACYEKLLATMLEQGFTRYDCVVAVGGGVVGDLAGFVAASYMRGVDFYNIPTTLLSQVDSSIGGKTALNLGGVKNVVGAFYQPKRVLIDPRALISLPQRQVSNGLAEAVKMALIADEALFSLFEQEDVSSHLPQIIESCLRIKKAVVEQDEKESGLRRVLNFGHTIGHGIESLLPHLYHGECVALGMLPLCGEAVRERLLPVLRRLHLPTSCRPDGELTDGKPIDGKPIDGELIEGELIYQALLHDKKASGGKISVVRVDEIGSCRIQETAPEELRQGIEMLVKGEWA